MWPSPGPACRRRGSATGSASAAVSAGEAGATCGSRRCARRRRCTCSRRAAKTRPRLPETRVPPATAQERRGAGGGSTRAPRCVASRQSRSPRVPPSVLPHTRTHTAPLALSWLLARARPQRRRAVRSMQSDSARPHRIGRARAGGGARGPRRLRAADDRAAAARVCVQRRRMQRAASTAPHVARAAADRYCPFAQNVEWRAGSGGAAH